MKTLIVLLCLLPSVVFADDPVKICPQNSFQCLKSNVDDLYTQDYGRFFRIYHKVFRQALRCKTSKAVTRYLTLYSAPHDSADVDEHMQRDTEALLLLKPECFFAGYAGLNQEQRDNFLSNYRLFSRPNHVMTLLRKYTQKGKYKKFAKAIYSVNLNSYQAYGKDIVDAPMSDLYQEYGIRK